MDETVDRNRSLRMAVLVEGGLGLLAVGLAWVLGIELREQFGGSTAGAAWAVGRGVVATLPMLLAFWLLVSSPHPALRRLRRQVEWVVDQLFHQASAAEIALVALLAGFGEELLFRGVLQPLVGRWTTPLVGLVVVSVLFGVAHAVSRLYFVLATVVGLYLGWLAWQYHDLVAPITAHAMYDFVALLYLARSGGGDGAEELDAPGSEYK